MTQDQIQATILSAQLKMADMVLANTTAEMGGSTNVNWYPAQRFFLNIKALQRQFNLGDYASVAVQAIYKCLSTLIGFDSTLNQIDPNYQPPANTIIVNEIGTDYEEGIIPFTNETIVSLTGYPTNYYPTYGNYPKVVIYNGNETDGYREDEGTAPVPLYVGNDFTQPLLSITWTYPFPTSGYILISGRNPNGSTTGGSGGGSTPISPGLPITNSSAVLLSNAELNAAYPFAQWGQLILLPNVPAKYEKLDNLPTGQWDLQTYTPNT